MNDEPEADDTEETGTRRARDRELATIEKIVRHLEDLEPNARRSALAYVTSRFDRLPVNIVREGL